MGRALSRHGDGTPNFECRNLESEPFSETITKSVLREYIEDLFTEEAEVALFYFAGHGTINNLGGYLVTQDAQRYDEGLPMTDVLQYANNGKVKEAIIILDCCHSGAFGTIPSFQNDQAILREGVSVLTGSRASQPSLEEDGGGIFTSLVHDALDGGASDVLGNITVAAVYAHVDQALGAWDQRPMFKTHVSKFVPIKKDQPEVGLHILRKLPNYFPYAHDELALDPSYEPDAKPKHKENEEMFAHLQKLRAARLLVPIGHEHMYYAAMQSKSCKLTPLGRFYWRLAKDNRL